MYNLQLIEERIVSILKKRGLSKNKLLLNCNLNKSVFDSMKRGGIPSVEKIHIIADYLDCSVDYILGRSEYEKVIDLPKDVMDTILERYSEEKDNIIKENDFMNYPNAHFKYYYVKEDDYHTVMDIYDRVFNFYGNNKQVMNKNEFIDLFEYGKFFYGYYALNQNNYNKFKELYKLYVKSFFESGEEND